jgi:hypothetical protein
MKIHLICLPLNKWIHDQKQRRGESVRAVSLPLTLFPMKRTSTSIYERRTWLVQLHAKKQQQLYYLGSSKWEIYLSNTIMWGTGIGSCR